MNVFYLLPVLSVAMFFAVALVWHLAMSAVDEVCCASRLLIGGIVDAYMQIMSIDEDGTAKVEKFGHWLSRSRNDEIVLDGVRER